MSGTALEDMPAPCPPAALPAYKSPRPCTLVFTNWRLITDISSGPIDNLPSDHRYHDLPSIVHGREIGNKAASGSPHVVSYPQLPCWVE